MADVPQAVKQRLNELNLVSRRSSKAFDTPDHRLERHKAFENGWNEGWQAGAHNAELEVIRLQEQLRIQQQAVRDAAANLLWAVGHSGNNHNNR